MKLFVKDIEGLKLPVQAHEGEDAAYDIVATTAPMIYGDKIERPLDGMQLWKRVIFIEYGTNLFIAPEQEDIVFWGHIQGAGNGGAIDWTDIGVDYHTQLWPRSSISNRNLILANSVGLVDTGYRNQILVRFKYLFQPEDMILLMEERLRMYGIVNHEHLYQQGEKIIQIKAAPNVPIQFEKVKELPESKRGTAGWGSSGK
jgi:dUTPase